MRQLTEIDTRRMEYVDLLIDSAVSHMNGRGIDIPGYYPMEDAASCLYAASELLATGSRVEGQRQQKAAMFRCLVTSGVDVALGGEDD